MLSIERTCLSPRCGHASLLALPAERVVTASELQRRPLQPMTTDPDDRPRVWVAAVYRRARGAPRLGIALTPENPRAGSRPSTQPARPARLRCLGRDAKPIPSSANGPALATRRRRSAGRRGRLRAWRDAEHISSLGFQTHAFDISPTAIRVARQRHSSSSVDYQTADLLDPPTGWARSFDLVVEIITVQAFPTHCGVQAIVTWPSRRPGGTLLAMRRARKPGDNQVKAATLATGTARDRRVRHRRARHCRDRTAYPPRRARRAAVASRVPPPYNAEATSPLSRP